MKTVPVVLFALAMIVPGKVIAQTAQDERGERPLTPKITVILQDQYVGSYYGLRE